MLYAGTTSIFSFKYSIKRFIKKNPNQIAVDIVKILKQWSQSAGNRKVLVSNTIHKTGTSETLRNEIVLSNENIKTISEHVPKHLKPLNDEQFGHYLAGLIDGNGDFTIEYQLVIAFDSLSVSLAYYLKQRIGYGKIKKVKDKNAYVLVIASVKGIEKVINLINNKIRSFNKLDQICNNIIIHKDFSNIRFNLNNSSNMNNHWLAGFSDANASFQIEIINTKAQTEVRLNFQIDQKSNHVLIVIKNYLGGNIGYRNLQNTYYYASTSFGSAKNVINYFDLFHMLSNKHVNYLKWRKAYIIIQDKNHLNSDGINKITKYKNTINKLQDNTI